MPQIEGYSSMAPEQGQDPADARLWVKFGMRPQEDPAATAEQGRPIFTEVEWITIMIPGERDTVERPMEKQDYTRFAKQYAHWKQTGMEATTGTPLAVCPRFIKVISGGHRTPAGDP